MRGPTTTALLAGAILLAIAAGCGPRKPDTSVPAIEGVDDFVDCGAYSVEYVVSVSDADGPEDILSVNAHTTTGNKQVQCQPDPNTTWDCQIHLGAGSWNVEFTVEDKAGWTSNYTDPFAPQIFPCN